LKRLLTRIGQLATCPPDHPQHDAGLIDEAALLIEDGRVAWCGPGAELPSEAGGAERHDCQGRLVVPGLIDCHTHLCFGGWRGDEFEMRLTGASYQDIAAAGGGIRHTVRHTRAATRDELKAKARSALDGMLALGVTTVECKSGYGLDEVNELRQLEIYRELDAEHGIDLVPTFLGAHVIPDEWKEDREGWLKLLCDTLLPEIAERGLARYCDAFVEQGAYTADEGDASSPAPGNSAWASSCTPTSSVTGAAPPSRPSSVRCQPSTSNTPVPGAWPPWRRPARSPSAYRWPRYTCASATCRHVHSWTPACGWRWPPTSIPARRPPATCRWPCCWPA
jgi:hypothetical protein